jgi:hypothetical protein
VLPDISRGRGQNAGDDFEFRGMNISAFGDIKWCNLTPWLFVRVSCCSTGQKYGYLASKT